MLAIIKKEVKSYFFSPIGYIFIGLFILMSSIFFYLDTVQYGSVNFEYLFGSLTVILTFIVPLLTMRMFSEERKNGTEQLLLTSPKSITSIVLGKFFAGAIVLFIAELVTLIYLGILMYFGQPNLLIAATTLLGFLLLGMGYISFGMFASCLTENQIIAGILSIGVFIAMWFMPYFNDVLATFSLISMFDKFPQGLIALDEIVAFVSFIALFVVLTIIVMQRRKSVK